MNELTAQKQAVIQNLVDAGCGQELIDQFLRLQDAGQKDVELSLLAKHRKFLLDCYHAQQFASMGFVSLAFDPSFGGESVGEVRNTASPDIFTEDYSAAVDYVGLLGYVDRERIGAVGICGLSGMAITAAGADTRIKAAAPLSMYDMSRDMSRGHMDYYTAEQRMKIKQYLSEQRWRDAESGTYALGNHEIGFGEAGNYLKNVIAAKAHLDCFGQLPEEKVILADGTDATEEVLKAERWLIENSF